MAELQLSPEVEQILDGLEPELKAKYLKLKKAQLSCRKVGLWLGATPLMLLLLCLVPLLAALVLYPLLFTSVVGLPASIILMCAGISLRIRAFNVLKPHLSESTVKSSIATARAFGFGSLALAIIPIDFYWNLLSHYSLSIAEIFSAPIAAIVCLVIALVFMCTALNKLPTGYREYRIKKAQFWFRWSGVVLGAFALLGLVDYAIGTGFINYYYSNILMISSSPAFLVALSAMGIDIWCARKLHQAKTSQLT